MRKIIKNINEKKKTKNWQHDSTVKMLAGKSNDIALVLRSHDRMQKLLRDFSDFHIHAVACMYSYMHIDTQ